VEILNMKRTIGMVAATALASAAFLSQAEAAPVISATGLVDEVIDHSRLRG